MLKHLDHVEKVFVTSGLAVVVEVLQCLVNQIAKLILSVLLKIDGI